MLPLFSPPPDDSDANRGRPMSAKLAVVLGVSVLAMLLALFMAAGRATSIALPIMVAVLVIAIGTVFTIQLMRRESTPDKGKRNLAEMDMYSLINRLVDDLNDDELAYLERQIEERKRQPDRSVIEDVGEALEQRDEARRAANR